MSTSLLKKAQVETKSILSASQRAPALLATNEERRTTKTWTPAVPQRHVTRKAVSVEQGHSTGCSTLHPLRNPQTARLSTALEHHPSADAAHDDRRIRCSISLQPPPNISLQQRHQGTQQVQIWAVTGAEVSTLMEGWFRPYFPDEVVQPTTKIFKAFNGARQPAIGQFTAEASFHGGSKVPILLYILPNDCMSLLGLKDMGMMDL
ncbi:MAG: hypothetical protein GY696_35215 [Gammaproteobacteria bacterium]|nr:hypothetical protein [Gammaproteobacteria bacterium]